MNFKILASALISVLLMKLHAIEALRCYVCEDCNEYAQLHELEVCGEPDALSTAIIAGVGEVNEAAVPSAEMPAVVLPPVSVSVVSPVMPAPAPAPAPVPAPVEAAPSVPAAAPAAAVEPVAIPAAPAVAVAAAAANQDYPYDSEAEDYINNVDQSDLDSPFENPNNSAVEKANSEAQGGGSYSEYPEDDYQIDYDNYDQIQRHALPQSSRRKQQQHRQGVNNTVCYTVHLNKNNMVITNRGCAVLRNNNKTATCMTIFNGSLAQDCDLCAIDNCNKPVGASDDIFNGSHQLYAISPTVFLLLGVSFILNIFVS